MSRDTTGMGGMGSMTDPGASAAGDIQGDSARRGTRMRSANEPNQTESGVTDSSGQSTLGKDVQKTRPDQSQPVTSKGDTINAGTDSAR
jgi:hypothetical protein